MQNTTDQWLDRVCMHLPHNRQRTAVRQELQAHLEDRMRLLHTQGMTDAEAAEQAVLAMGDPDILGRAIADTYHPLQRFQAGLPTFLVWLSITALIIYLLLCVLHGV